MPTLAREKTAFRLGFGPALLILHALKAELGITSIPEFWWRALAVAGTVLTIIGILSEVFSRTKEAKEPVLEFINSVVLRRVNLPLWYRPAEFAELPVLQTFYAQWFDNAPTLEIMRAWHGKYAPSFWVFYSQTPRAQFNSTIKLVGSFKLLPITEEAVEALLDGRVTGSTFKPEHICSDPDRAAAYYVGDLVSNSRYSGAVLHSLDEKCRDLLNTGRKIYGRAFTKKGARVMKNRGFVMVSNGSPNLNLRELCVLDPDLLYPDAIVSPRHIRTGQQRALAASDSSKLS